MNMNDIVIWIIVCFFCLGALDKLIGNRMGLGERFTEGFKAMGSLALVMIGIVSLAPVIAQLLIPVVSPVYGWVGADPATFANTLLAADMGGYALAGQMAADPEAALFAWVLLGTMMGSTIVFTIPVALGIIAQEDRPYLAKGILVGIATIPIGCFVGGLIAHMDAVMMLVNLVPSLVFSIIIGLGLWRYPGPVIQGFFAFGKLIEIVAIIGLVAIAVETLTGVVLIPNLAPISEGVLTVGKIAIILAGAFPMITFLTAFFHKHLEKLGRLLGIDQKATAGLIASLAHNIPMFAMLKEMQPRGKVVNVAFAVSGAFVFGGHLAFVAGVDKSMVLAMMAGKLTGGVTAVLLALLVTRSKKVGERPQDS
ncbi:ethanolamine utilization protein EutH [Paenibacillus phyllosphaerae]|nr:ethanolamine utilization protein EutH [Paenibacillus phyllosphaerae]